MNLLFLHHYDLTYGSGTLTRNQVGLVNSALNGTTAKMIAGNNGANRNHSVPENVILVSYPEGMPHFDLPLTGEMPAEKFLQYKGVFTKTYDAVVGSYPPAVHIVNHGYLWGDILRERNIPFVLEVHGTDEEVFNTAGYSELRSIQQKAIGAARAIICQSEDHKARAVQSYGINPERITVLHSGIDSEFYCPLEADRNKILEDFGIDARNKPVISYVGRLSPEKKVEILLDSLARLKPEERPVTLIAGSGPLEKRLKDICREYELAELHFLGKKSPEELIPIYNASDLIVMPSIETFGLAVLESMSCGTPVIGRDRGGTKDTIGGFSQQDSRGGELLYDGTAADLSEKIRNVLHADLKEKIGPALREWTRNHFDVRANTKKRINFMSRWVS